MRFFKVKIHAVEIDGRNFEDVEKVDAFVESYARIDERLDVQLEMLVEAVGTTDSVGDVSRGEGKYFAEIEVHVKLYFCTLDEIGVFVFVEEVIDGGREVYEPEALNHVGGQFGVHDQGVARSGAGPAVVGAVHLACRLLAVLFLDAHRLHH